MKPFLTLPTPDPFSIDPDVLIFSDLHLHERKEFRQIDETTGLNTRLLEGLNILDQIIDVVREHNIKVVKFLGDVFELKDRIPSHYLIEFKKRIEALSGWSDLTFLIGNHDFNLPKYPVIEVFNEVIVGEPCVYEESIGNIAYIPFQRSMEDFWKVWTAFLNLEPNIVFFHQEFPGAIYDSGKTISGSRNLLGMFRPGTLYFSGHLHNHQKVGPINFVGNPYHKTFSDEGTKKYVWLLNSKTKKTAPLKLKYPEFISFDINDAEMWSGECPNPPKISGNYIRVAGEAEAYEWPPENRKALREFFLAQGAKGFSNQAKLKRHHQVEIPEEKIGDDASIIQLFAEKSFSNSGLDMERLVRIGQELFEQS